MLNRFQDDFFILRSDHLGIYGVFDGHGPFGHEVSHFAHQLLPAILLRSELFLTNPSEALRKAFLKTQAQAIKATERASIDCSLSGTTGTVVYVNEEEGWGYCAHVGDSRAVMAVRDKDLDSKKTTTTLYAHDLSIDHKPGLPAEKARIHAAGGQVRCLAGDINDRVFVKNRLYPGLAMSRSLGDLVGASAGVTAEPEVIRFGLRGINDDSGSKGEGFSSGGGKDAEFLLVASDGVWEFISSQEAVDIVGAFQLPEEATKAAEKLAQVAWERWILEEGGAVVDDITALVIWCGDKKSGNFFEN